MSRKKQEIILNDEQQAALTLMESGANVFLTGKAGTGKSTVLAEFRKRCTKPAVYVAPTGIAALNIHGQTIHSCFQIKPGIMSDIEPLTSRKKLNLLSRLEVIVIDEISMVRSDLLTAIDVRMRQVVRGSRHVKPFGGCQVIVIGDFCQLPPVVEHENLYSYLQMRYGGIYAFQSAIWEDANFKQFSLNTIHRQSDEKFIAILNSVRVGAVDRLDQLNDRVDAEYADPVIRLTPYKATAEAINTVELRNLPEPRIVYTGVLEGRFPKDLPVDQHLELRVGSRVMIAANKYDKEGDPIYCNGELGEVTALDKDSVTVKRDSGSTIQLTPYSWDMYDFDYSGDKVESHVVGTYRQIPVRLAWAVTIHKSQGCTFDNVILDLGRGCFAHGQLYTALSRVKRLDGLSMTRAVKSVDVCTDRAVLAMCSE